MKALVDWLDERAGVRTLWAEFANERIPGGASPRYVFGSVLVFLFLQQVVLGILLATYYSPSATDAWASTAYITDQVTAGWFLRGLHHHGSSAMVVLTALHFLQTALAGAYKKPRELNWLTGLAMGGLVLAFALTGYLLPWDQKGYWATQVATGIMGSLPGGEPQRVLLQGGAEYGNLTITRFYALHVFVLPIGLAGLLGVHLTLFRRHGVTPPEVPQAELDAKAQRFFPSQLLWDLIAMAVTAAVLVLLTYSTHGAELFAPAQPASNFVARPEWYFLPLFQLLKYFEGPLQIVATVIIPGGLAAFLVLLPWIDRASSRKASERMPVVAALALLMCGIATLTSLALVEDKHNAKFQKGLVAAHEEAERARALAKGGVLPEGGEAVFFNDPVYKTRLLFKEHCQGCHTLGAEGGDNAPNLTSYKNREWLTSLIRNAQDKRFFGGTKAHRDMKAYSEKDLPEADLQAIVEYLTSLMGDEGAQVDAALAKKGQEIFDGDIDCNNCHMTKPGEKGDAPNFAGHGSRAWIERVIRDSSAPDLFGEAAEMTKFGKKLTDEQIRQLSDLVASQRKPGGSG
jgi:ubiquinol-cytochrome c reductase cytochrome b subunit